MFAFCPMTNRTMCAIDNEEDNRDMAIVADFTEQTIFTD